uniref:UDP-glycosyltransferases domain-containing protein n=1 Tax=Leersia perrieri TaxID=77586 RepID=A0A0D9WDW6_9ORYZ
MVGALARLVTEEHGVPFYTFFISSWMFLSLFLHLPAIDDDAGGVEHRDGTEPVRLPGCVPIHTHDLPGSMLADRSSDRYAGFLAMARDGANADGILVNTFRELEPAVGDVANGVMMPPVHAVGPLAWTRPVSIDRDHGCLSWLDQQPRGSVVYVSFGSGGTLTWQQTAELALGLELSHHRLIWAIKRPDQDTSSGAFFGTTHHGEDDDEIEFLPEGFIKRTRC